jgi:hypothetical protein
MAIASLLPENYLYISHLDEEFQFWQLPCTPETISDSMASTFNETSALGRSAPVFTYSKSGPRTVQISLLFHRDMMDALNVGVSNAELKLGEDYVDNLIKALQAIAVPRYNLSNKAVEPPLVALRLSQEVFIKGVVTSAIGLEYKLPILSNGKYAQVSLSFTVSEVDPYDATTVFQNGSFRGVVRTLKDRMGLNITD